MVSVLCILVDMHVLVLVAGEMPSGPAIVLALSVGLCSCVVLDLGRNNRIEVNLPWLPCKYLSILRQASHQQ